MAQFIDQNHICIVINSGNFDNENILQEYLRTVQNRIKGRSPSFRGAVFAQNSWEFQKYNIFAGDTSFSEVDNQIRIYYLPNGQILFEGDDHLNLSISVFKDKKFDIEKIVLWTLDKLGVPGYNGAIVNH